VKSDTFSSRRALSEEEGGGRKARSLLQQIEGEKKKIQ